MSEEEALNILRDKIDALDYQIHDLINERAKLALEVLDVKIKEHGKDVTFYRPEREKVIIENVKTHNQGPLDETTIANIFETIIAACRNLQINKNRRSS